MHTLCASFPENYEGKVEKLKIFKYQRFKYKKLNFQKQLNLQYREKF